MKQYYYVNSFDVLLNGGITIDPDLLTFRVDLLGKNYKSVKVVNATLSTNHVVQFSIDLCLESYTGNGLSTDRRYPICATFKYDKTTGVITDPTATPPTVVQFDFYEPEDFTPEYFISPSLNQLVFSFVGTSGTGKDTLLLTPEDMKFTFMLELEE